MNHFNKFLESKNLNHLAPEDAANKPILKLAIDYTEEDISRICSDFFKTNYNINNISFVCNIDSSIGKNSTGHLVSTTSYRFGIEKNSISQNELIYLNHQLAKVKDDLLRYILQKEFISEHISIHPRINAIDNSKNFLIEIPIPFDYFYNNQVKFNNLKEQLGNLSPINSTFKLTLNIPYSDSELSCICTHYIENTLNINHIYFNLNVIPVDKNSNSNSDYESAYYAFEIDEDLTNKASLDQLREHHEYNNREFLLDILKREFNISNDISINVAKVREQLDNSKIFTIKNQFTVSFDFNDLFKYKENYKKKIRVDVCWSEFHKASFLIESSSAQEAKQTINHNFLERVEKLKESGIDTLVSINDHIISALSDNDSEL